MSTTFIIQARSGSTRLPRKVLCELSHRSVLAWVVEAALTAATPEDTVIVATTELPEDEEVSEEARRSGAEVIRGPEEDVLTRFMIAMDGRPEGPIVRLTADCPLTDPQLLRWGINSFSSTPMDYLGTTIVRSLPRGIEVEVFSLAALRIADRNATGFDRSHVTSWMYTRSDLDIRGLTVSPSAEDLRVTLDTPEDLDVLRNVVSSLGDKSSSWKEVVRFLRTNPDVAAKNSRIQQKDLEEG
ncbi:MAG: spore coat polysaccharide biosynthesis protein SpsF [Actinomycetota bacterium]|nr:spore coat polysaccharide biosynthesis protein SpsF [Actinomycetota bacterium]